MEIRKNIPVTSAGRKNCWPELYAHAGQMKVSECLVITLSEIPKEYINKKGRPDSGTVHRIIRNALTKYKAKGIIRINKDGSINVWRTM